jgi:hypothetical protein
MLISDKTGKRPQIDWPQKGPLYELATGGAVTQVMPVMGY